MSQQLFNKLQELFGVTALESEMQEIILSVLKETDVYATVFQRQFSTNFFGFFFDKEAAHTSIKKSLETWVESSDTTWELMQTDLPHYSSNKGEELFVTKIEVK